MTLFKTSVLIWPLSNILSLTLLHAVIFSRILPDYIVCWSYVVAPILIVLRCPFSEMSQISSCVTEWADVCSCKQKCPYGTNNVLQRLKDFIMKPKQRTYKILQWLCLNMWLGRLDFFLCKGKSVQATMMLYSILPQTWWWQYFWKIFPQYQVLFPGMFHTFILNWKTFLFSESI